jgi:hypothetical protein
VQTSSGRFEDPHFDQPGVVGARFRRPSASLRSAQQRYRSGRRGGAPAQDGETTASRGESDRVASLRSRDSPIALASGGAAETAAWPQMRKRGGRVQPEPVRGLFVGG